MSEKIKLTKEIDSLKAVKSDSTKIP